MAILQVLYIVVWACITSTCMTERCGRNPAVHHFKIGSMNAVVLFDGPGIFPTVSGIFSAPLYAVNRSLEQNFRSTAPFLLSQNILLVNTPSGNVLVDTGSVNIPFLPSFDEGGKLLRNLKAANVKPESIRHILLTHAHADHCSGLLKKNGKVAFPNARVYISETDHNFWSHPTIPYPNSLFSNDVVDQFSNAYLRSIRPYKDRITLVPDNGSPLPGIEFIPTPGHSPGHVAISISDPSGESIVLTGDAWVTKSDQLQNPDWSLFIEFDPALAFHSRVRLLHKLAMERTLALAYHESFPGLGYVTRNGPFFNWVPADTTLIGAATSKHC